MHQLWIVVLFLYAGKQTFGANIRIIGGQPAYINTYPFTAAINVQTGSSKFFCGGALYTDQWIITAGQCVDGAVLFTIRLGSTYLESDESTAITLATSEYVLHPDFDSMTLDNDIGLIKLQMPVEFSDFMRSVQSLAQFDLYSQTLRAIGWGQVSDSNSSLSNELQWTYVSVILNEDCRTIYGNQITDSMVCVVGSFNQGSCHGDTGSPLINNFRLYTDIHVGVASFVSSNGCESTDPSGYTRTRPFVSWILNITRSSK